MKAENAELKTIIEKKDYRIKHLIRSLEEEEQKEAEIAKLKYRINILLRSLEEAEGNAYAERIPSISSLVLLLPPLSLPSPPFLLLRTTLLPMSTFESVRL